MFHSRRFGMGLLLWTAIVVTAPAIPFAHADEVVKPDNTATGATIVSVTKIWDQGEHNAFTDLIRWHDAWFCVFRESAAHVGGDGHIRVLRSSDGEHWASVAEVTESGIDLRDPKLDVAPDDRLMLTMGGSVYEGTTMTGRQPRASFSKDGTTWSVPQRVLAEGDWLWRTTWHAGRAYGTSYNASSDSKRHLQLYASDNGVDWNQITQLDVPDRANETTLRFTADGEMLALVRREAGSTLAWIGRSQSPYTAWTWTETAHRVGGPNFIHLPSSAKFPEGRWVAGGRSYPGGAKMTLAWMTPEGGYEPFLSLPSGGDCSYPGMVWHDDQLWVSYYSSHEGKSSIYVARIRLAGD